MARLWMSGAEDQDTAVFSTVVVAGAGASFTATTDQPRTGAASFKAINPNVNGADAYATVTLPANKTEIFVRVALYLSALPSWRAVIIELLDDIGTNHLALCVETDGQLKLYRIHNNGTLLAAGSFIVAGQYYLLELRATIADAGGVGVVRLNTAVDINFSGDTRNAGNANIRTIYIGLYNPLGTVAYNCTAWLDDIAINDTAGATQNSYPGNSGIYLLTPDGPGNYTNIPTLVGAATHWEAVDDVPPDNDTSYVEGDVVDDEDTYTMTAVPVSGTITAVKWMARAKLDAAGTGSLARLYRIGGVDYQGSDIPLGVGYTKLQ